MNLTIKQVQKTLRKTYRPAIIILMAVLFFLVTSSFNYYSQAGGFVKWLSPDETANYNFAKLYGQEGRLSIYEGYNLYAQGIIYPRSFRSDYGVMKPVSFLGIILIYGRIVSLTSYKVLPYLTPLFGAIAIFYYYLLLKRIFGQINAFISAALLSCFPVFVYYSARSMFHNILFICMLIIGLYYAVLAGQKNENKTEQKFCTLSWPNVDWLEKILYPILSGFFIGLCVITRTSELLWLAPMLFFAWFFNMRRFGLMKVIIFFAGLTAAILPALYWNQILYGSPISTGYPEMNQSVIGLAQTSGEIVKEAIIGRAQQPTLFEKLKSNIFHFGFHPKESVKVFRNYFVYMFSWLFWPGLLGLLLLIQDWRRWKLKHFVFLLCLSIFSIVLIFYYGSWDFHDNPDANSYTIGNSYTRYWLPIYLAWIPLFSLFLMRFSNALYQIASRATKNKVKNNIISNFIVEIKLFFGHLDQKLFVGLVRLVVVFVIFIFSFRFVAFGSEEGLIYQVKQQQANKADYNTVMNLTESNSVIITRYHDKLFFPERKVIVGLFDDSSMIAQYEKLSNLIPVYYYNFSLHDTDLVYLNSKKLFPYNLKIRLVSKISKDFSLYKLEK